MYKLTGGGTIDMPAADGIIGNLGDIIPAMLPLYTGSPLDVKELNGSILIRLVAKANSCHFT